MAQSASEETCVTAREKERISLASHTCQKLPPFSNHIYSFVFTSGLEQVNSCSGPVSGGLVLGWL